jgi:hypothetical protein
MSPPTFEDEKMSIKKLAGLAAFAALLLGTASAWGQNGMAYGRSQAPAPLEGTWDVVITPYVCTTGTTFPSFRSRLTFMAGGTMIEVPFNPSFQAGQRSPGLGTWERTGQASYRSLFEAFIYFTSVVTPPTPPRYFRGVQRIDQGIEMQGTDRWTSSAQVTAVDEAGSPYMAGCMTALGTRQQ